MKNIIVPMSGGKDSTACMVMALKEKDASVVGIFNDTGWEHEETYEYFNYLKTVFHIPIYKTTDCTKRGKRIKGLEDLIIEQGRFPFGLGRFCTMYLKQYALRDYYKDNIYDGETKHEIWFGMRTDESGQRARKYAGIESTDIFNIADLFPNRWNKKLQKTVLDCLL